MIKTGQWTYLGLAMAMGALGVLVRILVSESLNKGGFPWGTFAVNASGSLVIGILFALQTRSEPNLWLMALAVGFLGALTTFSTFSLDSVKMISAGQPGPMLAYVAATNLVCLGFCYLGTLTARWL